MSPRNLIALAPLALFCACASPGLVANAPAAAPAVLSPYGMFLAGDRALNDGRSGEAQRYFDQARLQGGGEAVIAERAFTAALLAGEVDKAAGLAPTSDDTTEAARRMGRLVQAVEALADSDGKAAKALLAADTIGFPHKPAAALLSPWAAAAAGDLDSSLVRPQVRGDAVVDYFGQLGQAHLLERARRYDEAETNLQVVSAGATPSEMALLAHGGFLERRGRRPEALAQYDAGLRRDPNSIALRAARNRAQSGKGAPSLPSIRESAALALLAPAATMISAKQAQIGLAYLRLALRLDPQRNDAWLMVGDFMQGAGDSEGARLAYGKPRPGQPEYPAGQAKLAWTYQTAGDKETAIKLARAAAATGDEDARTTLSDLYRANERHAESVEVLNFLIAARTAPDWRLHYSRGVSLERLGRWPEAEADLITALKARPEEPELLNYLGYSWIDRGERLTEAMGMVEKAVASNPQSGAMIDSLGWAYFRLGDFKMAVEKLEQAVELDAGDPEINNHLGDAYWRVGRRDEAFFQWRRVLTLNPEAKVKAEAERKIASGLDGPAPRLAGQ